MNLHVIKIGGNIIDNDTTLREFTADITGLKEPFILVHGGGKLATTLSSTLGIETQMSNGRRITDAETLKVVVMVYAGLINKNIVAQLQARGCNAIGLTGADGNIIPAKKRQHPEIDFGFVGDILPGEINTQLLKQFIDAGLIPVVAPLTHDDKGQLLNTNADTIAASLAVALAPEYEVQLHYCFEKNGVLRDKNDDNSVIPEITAAYYNQLKNEGIISDGMIPKLDNAFAAIGQGVREVSILHARNIRAVIQQETHAGTRLING